MLRYIAVVLLSLSIAPATALSQEPSVEQPSWEKGGTWTLKFLPLGKVLVRFTSSGCVPNQGCPLMFQFSGGEAQLLSDIPNIAPNYQSNTYFSVFDWPLVQGKTWTHVGKATGWTSVTAQGGEYATSDSWRTVFTVVAFERVGVLTGTFDAVRIAAKQCNESQQNVCRDFAIWYAPQTKYFAKIEYSGANDWPSPPRGGRWELFDYKLY